MSSELRSVTFDARDPERLTRFWTQILGRGVDHSGAGLLPTRPGDFAIRFAEREPSPGLARMHFDLTSATAAEQDSTVARALELGASHLDVGQLPEEEHVVLADPEGNAFCVIPPGNAFLADTARIGALSCDGSRAVGLFWAAVLDWPLVWDEGEETAIQSPAGGTKITWGGPPDAPEPGLTRRRLDIAPGRGSTQAAEVERLVSLGARRLDRVLAQDEVLMADPDGTEFSLLDARA